MNKIPEERMPAILKRAAELDRATITADSIRVAAIEAGISATAVDQAIEEYSAKAIERTVPQKNFSPRSWIRRVLNRVGDAFTVGAATFLLGALTSEAEALIPAAALGWAYLTFQLAKSARRQGNVGRFYSIMLGFGIGLVSGAAAFSSEDVAMSFVLIGAGLLIAGGVYIHLRWNNLLQGSPESNNA